MVEATSDICGVSSGWIGQYIRSGIGGYVVGTSIVLGEAYLLRPLNIPTEFQLLIPLIAVIIILLIAPQGLVGLISKITQKKV